MRIFEIIVVALLVVLVWQQYLLSNAMLNDGREKRLTEHYKLMQLSNMRRDQFMIDSETGRVWSVVCVKPGKEIGDCSDERFQPISYMNDNLFVDHVSTLAPVITRDLLQK